MSDARRRAEEALAEWDAVPPRMSEEERTALVHCASALRALLAESPAPAPPDELRKAAERHYSTLLSGLAYVVRGSWWPEHDELTNGVREHVAKMRDAADELRALAARGGE